MSKEINYITKENMDLLIKKLNEFEKETKVFFLSFKFRTIYFPEHEKPPLEMNVSLRILK